jgi:hypothetical protein
MTNAKVLQALAVYFAGRGIMNLLKRFGTGSGFVFLGRLLPPDTWLAPLFGLVLIAYAWGLWTRAGWAIAIGVGYSAFATANLLLFPAHGTLPGWVAPWMYGVYAVVGIVGSWGSVWLLSRARTTR